MRILHVHSGNLYGGVETVLRSFADVLSPESQEFAFTCDARIASELRCAGQAVHIIGDARARAPLSVLRATRKLARLCRLRSFDVIAMHSAWTVALFGGAACIPVVFFQHDVLRGKHWTERLAARRRVALSIANSEFTARFSRHPWNAPRAVVHPPLRGVSRSIPTEERICLRTQWGAGAGDTVVLIAARFERWKGHELLIESLARALKTGSTGQKLRLWIAGEAQRPAERRLLQELRAKIRRLGLLDRAVFLGHRADLPALMQAADLYCQPNTGPEPFGLTFVEALRAGIPIVTTRLGGAQEILALEFGILTSPDPSSVADALVAAANNDPLRCALGARGPKRAETLCDPGRQVTRYMEAIGGVVGARAQ